MTSGSSLIVSPAGSAVSSEPRIRAYGPCPAKIMIVGEAPGTDDIRFGFPFMGSSGRELKAMLKQAEIDPGSVFQTCVFMSQPKDNKIENFCASKAEVGGKDYTLPPLSMGKYFRPELLFDLTRLAQEIQACQPDLIIALGNTAIWALLGQTGIGKMRGSKFESTLEGAEGFAVIPTYHPAAVLRQWDLRVIVVQDFIKCARFVREGFHQLRRRLLVDPTIEEVESWFDRWIFSSPPAILSFDIETKRETITCIGFSPAPDEAICIPFFDPAQPDGNFWRTFDEELRAYNLCKRVLEDPSIPKLGQNGLYDIQYLFRYLIRVTNYTHDTMIRHHALYPELEKGLGFMGTIYTDEAPWKLLRNRNKDNFKLDDE